MNQREKDIYGPIPLSNHGDRKSPIRGAIPYTHTYIYLYIYTYA